MRVRFRLNGKWVEVDSKPNEILLDTLRLKLGVRSVKRGCETAECGACTVLLDGKPVYTCTILTPMVEGKEVLTVDYLAETGELQPLMEAFAEHGAVQCGFCTPGFTLTAYAFLKQNPEPSEWEVRKAIEGNLCRCTGYQKIVEAILDAAERMRKSNGSK